MDPGPYCNRIQELNRPGSLFQISDADPYGEIKMHPDPHHSFKYGLTLVNNK